MSETLTLTPIKHATGQIVLPGSKSLTNRILLLAAIAEGNTDISNLLISEDTQHMVQALRQLGVSINLDERAAHARVQGLGHLFPPSKEVRSLSLGNAGTAIRPLTAMLSMAQGTFLVDGDAYMRERPIAHLIEALQQIGADIHYLDQPGYPPFKINNADILGGKVELDGRLSSQYLTALLMSLPLAPQDSQIDIIGDLVSKPYIDITRAVMQRFGVETHHDQYRSFHIPGDQTYKSPGKMLVEGDASTASYFLAAGAIRGEVTVHGIGQNSLQGDVDFVNVLAQMGARIEILDSSVHVASTGHLKGIDIDLNHIPDAAMTVAVVALFAKGRTTIRNIYNWRIKETDRMSAMAAELQKVGADVTVGEDSISILPPDKLQPAEIETYGDHRMAMCFSLIAMSNSSVTIKAPEVTAKTFPDYFTVFDSICHR
ncbi:MAG: 3-phosphoshikimate 1-carboxyvinyltransferase [Pseudomonadales bacterium]